MKFTEAEVKKIQAKQSGKEIIPLEDEEYDLIVKYLDDMGFVYTHIPMETYTTSWKVKNRNTRIGVKSGFPDYVIIIPYWWVGKRHNILLFAEIKRRKGATLRANQKEWLHNLRSCNELAEVFYGADELKAYIEALRT
jgi:hypothetical protein